MRVDEEDEAKIISNTKKNNCLRSKRDKHQIRSHLSKFEAISRAHNFPLRSKFR